MNFCAFCPKRNFYFLFLGSILNKILGNFQKESALESSEDRSCVLMGEAWASSVSDVSLVGKLTR